MNHWQLDCWSYYYQQKRSEWESTPPRWVCRWWMNHCCTQLWRIHFWVDSTLSSDRHLTVWLWAFWRGCIFPHCLLFRILKRITFHLLLLTLHDDFFYSLWVWVWPVYSCCSFGWVGWSISTHRHWSQNLLNKCIACRSRSKPIRFYTYGLRGWPAGTHGW